MVRSGEYFTVPIEVAREPRSGEVICGGHWLVDRDGALLFWSARPLASISPDATSLDFSPQCSTDVRISDKVLRTTERAHAVREVPMVFLTSVRSHLREMLRKLHEGPEDGPAMT